MGGHGGGHLQNLFRCFLQLVLHVQRAGCQKQMDPGIGSVLYGLPGRVDVFDGGPGERCDRAFLHSRCDGLHAFKITGRRDGKTGLDDVDLQTLKAFGYLNLFLQVH